MGKTDNHCAIFRLNICPSWITTQRHVKLSQCFFLTLFKVECLSKLDPLFKDTLNISECFVYVTGMHVDVARNFQPKSTILLLLDAMSMYKLNKLHLHLSDDEGWRLEIPGLEELTKV